MYLRIAPFTTFLHLVYTALQLPLSSGFIVSFPIYGICRRSKPSGAWVQPPAGISCW